MQALPPRPTARRPALLNELGQRQTPPSGPDAFQIIGHGPRIILLGLGPDPDVPVAIVRDLAKRQGEKLEIIYTDCPEFAAQMAENQHPTPASLPAHWRKMAGEEVEKLLKERFDAEAATFILYLPGLRLFPSFFGPLFGAVWARLASPDRHWPIGSRSGRGIRSVTLAGSERDLLHRELRLAFADAGIETKLWNPEAGRETPDADRPGLSAPPEDSLGDLFLSVNFKGLDPFGAIYHYLRARDVAVAVWCVDNPWHLLSGLRAPYWRELPLFITDHSFLPGLKAHGAKQAHHLPLAACPELFAPAPAVSAPGAAPSGFEPDYLKNLAPLVFIGRTAFPGRDKFFAAQRLPETFLAKALQSLETGARPDFQYWAETFGLAAKLWPGHEARKAGLAAEECSRRRRTLCVSAAARHMQSFDTPGLTLFGDAAWREELADLPEGCLDLRGTLDYYSELPALYRASELVLNVTSLLLPAGLNQRHFDVWLAGAAQICDPSPGLDIFPQELVQPLLFHKPADIPSHAEALLSDPPRLRGLRLDWQALLLAEHTYAHRVRALLNALE